ncbi:hypothetical protein GGR58DRAFT_499986 [Xylaria digitata]|nr:hypothetical protein GGR58DRAFT_499986 [Xylaria digitata]
MRLSLLLVWLYSGLTRSHDPSSIPTAENFLRRIGPSVTVIGDYLYIEGGTMTQLIDGEADPLYYRPVNETLSISLSQAWSNSPPLAPISKAAPTFIQPLLWTDIDKQTFYQWGGQRTQPDPTKHEFWAFTADGRGGGDWSIVQPANPSVFLGIRRGRGASWTTCNGLGVALGGYGWAETDSDLSDRREGNFLPLPGLLSYNLSTGIWANQSADAFNGLGTCHKGSAVCLSSSGTQGIVLPLGGLTSSRVVYNNAHVTLNRFDNLTFYDLGTETWYWQIASGEIPPGRTAFCSVVLQGPNGTSEIYIYGGNDLTANAAKGDIYVLSLPGFVWFKLSLSREFPRWGHDCAVGGRSQIIVVGGQSIWPDGPESLNDPDPWPQGIGVFDLQNLDWSDSYQPDAMKYQTPRVVDDWYRAGNSSTPNNGASDTSKKAPEVATIVGVVLGITLFLALVAGLIAFRWRRQALHIHRSSSVRTPLKVLKVRTVRRIKRFNIFEFSAETRPSELDAQKQPQELESTEVSRHFGS